MMDTHLNTKRILIFLAFAIGIPWAATLAAVIKPELEIVLNWTFITAPALASIATRLITREGWGRLWLRPNFRRGWRFYLGVWLLPLLAVMVGGAISCIVSLPMVFPFNSTTKDIALMAFLGVFQLGLPCMLLVLASRALLAPEIALLGLLEVVLGPLWAWLGAGEVPARATLIGGAVVIGALLFNELAGFRRIMAAKLSATRISG